MTTDKLTTEEKQLWTDGFKFENLCKKTIQLYKKYQAMAEGELEHSSEEIIEVENEFLKYNEMMNDIELVKQTMRNVVKLIELNPNYRWN